MRKRLRAPPRTFRGCRTCPACAVRLSSPVRRLRLVMLLLLLPRGRMRAPGDRCNPVRCCLARASSHLTWRAWFALRSDVEERSAPADSKARSLSPPAAQTRAISAENPLNLDGNLGVSLMDLDIAELAELEHLEMDDSGGGSHTQLARHSQHGHQQQTDLVPIAATSAQQSALAMPTASELAKLPGNAPEPTGNTGSGRNRDEFQFDDDELEREIQRSLRGM